MARQSVEKAYLEMTDFDIFKNTKCLAGISNLFGMSQAIKRQFGNGFPGLHSPRKSCLYRCDDCTRKRLEKLVVLIVQKQEMSVIFILRIKPYYWLKPTNAGELFDVFCR